MSTIGQVDNAAPEIKEREKREEQDRQLAELKKKEKKRAKKMRGKDKIGNKQASGIRQMHEGMRERNKLAYLQNYKKAKQ